MANGLQVWDASGDLLLDVTDSLTRIVGTVSIPTGTSGSVQLPEGRVWWHVMPTVVTGLGISPYAPNISVNANNVMSWSPDTSFQMGQVDVSLIYGVY